MRNFRKLRIWVSAVDFTKNVYLLTNEFPFHEKYGLSSQMQRAAVSIASNIAEGSSRKSQVDFARFLEISIGSSFEIETQLIIAKGLNYIKEEKFNEMINQLTVIQKQTNQLISKLR
ncbi:MAG: four helix bundle protein [Bacteroidales bacterium]|nr:four helix bundle protein [Bacteroidales bacterium]